MMIHTWSANILVYMYIILQKMNNVSVLSVQLNHEKLINVYEFFI